MAKFVFKLEGYHNIKVKLEDQKKFEFYGAMKKLAEERQIKENLVAERYSLLSDIKKSVEGTIDLIEYKKNCGYLEVVKKRIIIQEDRIAYAEKFVEMKRLELVEAVKSRKTLDILKDRAKVEYLKEEQLAEQKVVDEIVSYKYNKQVQ